MLWIPERLYSQEQWGASEGYDAGQVTQSELGGRALHGTEFKMIEGKGCMMKTRKEISLWGALVSAMHGSGEVEIRDEAAEEGLRST